MSSEYLEALELLVLIFHLLLDQLYHNQLIALLLSMSFFNAGLRDSEIKGSSSRIWSISLSMSVLHNVTASALTLALG